MSDTSEPRSWVLTLPGSPPLSMNQRGHWAKHSDAIAQWRYDTAMLARADGVPALKRAEVTLHIWPPDRRHRDRHNLHATLKPILDGLVDAHVLPGDTPQFLEREEIILHPYREMTATAISGLRRWTYRLVIQEADPMPPTLEEP
jgi:crossover junction endodeoxyribonuclease RusA